MTNRMSLGGAGIAVALSLAVAGVARADDASDKAQLEQRVKDLERELGEVKSTLKGGYFTANSDLEARVSELERMAGDGTAMGCAFKSGLNHDGGDGAFAYHWFGLIQNDWTWYVGDGDFDNKTALGNDFNPGVDFRRVRLGVNGQMYGNVRWWSEVDFAGGGVRFADMWMELAHCSFGNIRVGRMKEPMGFDQYTGDRTLQFMERNYVNNLMPGRNVGIMLHGLCNDDSVLYQVGMFREDNAAGDDLGNAKDGEYNLTARVSGRPMVQDDGTTWLHLGLSLSMRDYADDTVAIGAGPANAQAPNFIATSAAASDGWLWGLEACYVTGPWTLLGEYGDEKMDLVGAGNASVNAWSVEAGYWLTGENTGYDKAKGSWTRAMPKHNFGDGDGQGAWRVALRYDTMDLDDNSLNAGSISQWTFGCSWLLNPNTAVHLNWSHVNPDDPADALDSMNVLGLRFEIDF